MKTVEDEEILKTLLPCPFCGKGITRIRKNGSIWTGSEYSEYTSISVQHFCEKKSNEGITPIDRIEIVGKDLQQAIQKWNTRVYSNPGC